MFAEAMTGAREKTFRILGRQFQATLSIRWSNRGEEKKIHSQEIKGSSRHVGVD